MPHDCITDPKHLLREIGAFGERVRERRRFERQALRWTATVEVRGQRFEGVITDLSPGGARIKFDAAVQKGDELRVVLRQLNELGAKVVWQRQGEAGLSFVLAPEEVAVELRRKIAVSPEQPARPKQPQPARSPAPPAPSARVTRPLAVMAAAVTTMLALLVLGSLFFAGPIAGQPVAMTVANSDSRDCTALLGKITSATNQVDFDLNVASAAEAKCLDLQHLGQYNGDRSGHMTHATKVPLR
jgi:hypothetical protein